MIRETEVPVSISRAVPEMDSANSAQSSSDGEDDEYAVAASRRRRAYPRDPHVTQQHYNPFSATAPPPADDGAWSAGRSTANTQPAGRKRTRASRRAPTTVLTTDTSNFRAMVQEFTGIPASPFSSSSSSTNFRARLDELFGGSNRGVLPDLPGQHRRYPYLQMTRPPTTRSADVTNYQMPMSDPGLFGSLPSNNFPVSVATDELMNWAEEGLGPTVKPPISINRLLLHPGSGTSGDRCEGMLESWVCSADH